MFFKLFLFIILVDICIARKLVQKLYTSNGCNEDDLFAVISMQYGNTKKRGLEKCEIHQHDTYYYHYETQCKIVNGTNYLIHKKWDHTNCQGTEDWIDETIVPNCYPDYPFCRLGIIQSSISSYNTKCVIHDNGDHNLTHNNWYNRSDCPVDKEPSWKFTEKINQCNNYGGVSRYGYCEIDLLPNMAHVIFFNSSIFDGCSTETNKLFEVWLPKPNECFYFDEGFSMFVYFNSTYVSLREYNSPNCNETTETWREEYKLGECTKSTITSRRKSLFFNNILTNNRRTTLFGNNNAMFINYTTTLITKTVLISIFAIVIPILIIICIIGIIYSIITYKIEYDKNQQDNPYKYNLMFQ
jgi:hypothetical protein